MNLDDTGEHSGVAVDHSRTVLTPQLAALLGDANVLTGATSRRFYAQDVHGSGVLPLAVVRPGSVEELAAAVQLVTAAGAAVVARGGGMSYTDGYLPISENTVTFDTTRLNRIVEINPRDRYVTVECGVTWKALAEALAPHALRTPYWGPLSGLRATVGGALSQGSVFLCSGLHGPVQESLLALEVVLADGSLLKTGGAALAQGVPFFRHFGPDLSSLFTGDCGAFGIKVRATLRLIPAPAESCYLSFSLAEAEAVFARHATELERLGIDHGFLSCTVGGNGVLVEPCIYWPDARQAFHETVLDPAYLAKLPVFAENLPARQVVAQLRGELADLFAASGAASFQIGKLCRYRASLDAGTLAMLDALKRQLDPRGLMNPGVLGFAAPTV